MESEKCEYNSGSPLTMAIDGQCILVGIVSEGKDCGSDQYGKYMIFANIQEFHDNLNTASAKRIMDPPRRYGTPPRRKSQDFDGIMIFINLMFDVSFDLLFRRNKIWTTVCPWFDSYNLINKDGHGQSQRNFCRGSDVNLLDYAFWLDVNVDDKTNPLPSSISGYSIFRATR
ncbi:unnamed protein product [Lepeophtheirus salmonis]|nr:unnamed protein product [Lepeophtheirus salmonis]CAF2807410.1 unnamed protein product [Lepeophtheirus salmonis]